MKGFAFRLVLEQRHKRTWKWPILFGEKYRLAVMISVFFLEMQGVSEFTVFIERLFGALSVSDPN